MATPELSRREEAQVMELAVDLYAEELRAEEQEERARSMIAAAREVGVPEAYVKRAADVVRQRKAADALRRKRLARNLTISAVVVAAAAGAIHLLQEPPLEPFVESFDAAGDRWSLNKNPESEATATLDGVAHLQIERFGLSGDGKFHVNLDRVIDLPAVDRHETVSFRARARGLRTLRLYLEGSDERWRSPPVTPGPAWSLHRLPLASFEHQTRTGDGWRVTGKGDPRDVRALSFKVGHYMNPANATGEVELDDLRFE